MKDISIKIFTPQELNHSSYIQSGLFELEADGLLTTEVKLSLSKRLGTFKIINQKLFQTKQPHPKTSFYELTDKSSGKKIKFAIDLYDASTSFSSYALENCDFVFKRNFEQCNIDLLPEKYQDKLFTFGLTFGCHSKNIKQWWKFELAFFIITQKFHFKIDSYFFKRINKGFKLIGAHLKHVNKTQLISDFDYSKSQIFTNSVLFQTRCFPNEETCDVREIHKQRYVIIKLLREKFDKQFKGGFIPSKLAKEKYNDVITNLPTDQVAYINEVKSAKIVIYTRGLAHSPAWKMAEYLSQGKVIIAEKLTAELPVNLKNGREVLFFENEEEIVTLIETTINDPNLCDLLAKNARNYFEHNVHPKENVKRIINFMIKSKFSE